MTWMTPMTAVANDIFKATDFNTYVRDNLNATEAAKVTANGQYVVADAENSLVARSPVDARVDTAQTKTGSSWGDLATAGPTVTVTTGVTALVHIASRMKVDTDNISVRASFAVSGATTIAEESHPCNLIWDGVLADNQGRMGSWSRVTLNPGSNTFKMRYRTGGSSATGTWQYRYILVLPL